MVAITGLVGVGKTALAETLFGLRKPLAGKMTLGGAAYAPASPRQAIDGRRLSGRQGPRRKRHRPGLQHLREYSLPFLDRISPPRNLAAPRRTRIARRQISDLGIVCRTEKDDMSTLSGGNQQKVMVARWMPEQARLFILDEPFQGVDIAARRDIAAKLRASAAGRATLIFVTELDEALETADRILVMSEHTIVGEHRNAGAEHGTPAGGDCRTAGTERGLAKKFKEFGMDLGSDWQLCGIIL